MTDRFYSSFLPETGTFSLTGSEAHHMHNVLRLKQSQEVLLFDGAGTEATAEIISISKRSVELRILDKRSTPSKSQRTIILATAVPKGGRFRWLVEKATELGVTRLIPLITERSIVDPGSGKLEKMKQTVIAACKQCGRNQLMQIDEPIDWNGFIDRESQSGLLLVAHPSGEKPEAVISGDSEKRPMIFAVGPEGGFTETEISTAVDAGGKLISLGPNILRIETAAVALAAFYAMR
jgi:16S rRNA (uracil1498-N3)-methyltransferase